VCDTDITDAEIAVLITESDAYLDTILNTGALSALVRQMLSRHYTAYTCMKKDPDALKLGELSTDRSTTIKLIKEEFDTLVSAFGGGIAFTPAVETLGA